MTKLKVNQRVTLPNHPFLSDRYVMKYLDGFGYWIKLDKKAPNTYAFNTDEILMFPEDVVAVIKE